MGQTETSTTSTTDGSLSRRRILKGAAAVGVGAVAWSAPNIKTFGFAPAYAQVCTKTATFFEVGRRNTACTCDPAAGTLDSKVARYKEMQDSCGTAGVLAFPGSIAAGAWTGQNQPDGAEYTYVVVADGDLTGVGDNGNDGCPPGYLLNGNQGEADAHLHVAANTLGLYCQAVVTVGGSCGNPGVPYYSAVLPPDNEGWVAMPPAQCQAGGNLFLEIRMQCSKDPWCLDPETAN